MPSKLSGLIAEEIARHGPMTLARFMELALYAPGLGYYERRQPIGRRGDFFTSVSVGNVFGDLLAFQFARWLEPFPRPQIIEAGAHNGRLAADILHWLHSHRPELAARLEYCLIESSPARQEWQRETLQSWRAQIRWLPDIEALEPRSVHGVIFSNELLDALPAHRSGWDVSRRQWREWRVAVENGEFVWRVGEVSLEAAPHLPVVAPELATILPDGYTVEISPATLDWWRCAAARLSAGKLLTMDYGFGEDEWLHPRFAEGTLRGFAGHHAVHPLHNPGEQDITAHVHFPSLQRAGEQASLRTESFVRQETFLTQIFAQTVNLPGEFAPWTPDRVRQFQTLTHPEHLGRAFKVLVQSAP